MIWLSASILSLSPFSLLDQIKRIEDSIDYLHLDIMDGHFVPRITFGQQFVEELRNSTNLPLDVHLMITNPEKQIESYLKAGGTRAIVHIESINDFAQLQTVAESYNKQLCLSISPNTPFAKVLPYIKEIDSVLIMTVHPGFPGQKFLPNAIEKIAEANVVRKKNSLDFRIMVDGGINVNTAKNVIKAGADILVIGTGLFSSHDPLAEIEKLRALSTLS